MIPTLPHTANTHWRHTLPIYTGNTREGTLQHTLPYIDKREREGEGEREREKRYQAGRDKTKGPRVESDSYVREKGIGRKRDAHMHTE